MSLRPILLAYAEDAEHLQRLSGRRDLSAGVALIYWAGEAGVWERPDRQDLANATYVFSASEDAVWTTATMGRYDAKRRLSRTAALRCTQRLLQRAALEGTGLNPQWCPTYLPHQVVKAHQSCENSRVRFFPTTDADGDLFQAMPHLFGWGVSEAFVHGEAIEVDGIIRDGTVQFLPVVRQHWNATWDHVEGYELVRPLGYRTAVSRALRAIGLNQSAFCVELRRRGSEWVVIEVHARFGEDDRLAACWGGHPMEVLA